MKTVKFIDDITIQYRLGKLLGKGAFGSVYVCTNVLCNQQNAMKIVRKDSLAGDESLVKLMKQEIEVLRNVNHPHIVRVIDLFEDSVNFYIVTELMQGGELYEHMLSVKRLGER